MTLTCSILILSLSAKEWWSDEEEKEMLASARKQVLTQLRAAEKLKKPPASELFKDVYNEVLPHLQVCAFVESCRVA